MSRSEGAKSTFRLLLLAGCGLLWAAAIVYRLVQLQVVQHQDLKARAERQQHAEFTLRPNRGAIFDRTGRTLAISMPADTVCINPKRLPDRAVAADILSRVLQLDRQELSSRIEAALYSKGRSGFLPVKKKISVEESERLRSLNLEWIEFRTEGQRYYPNGPVAAHAIGAVNFQEHGNLGLEQKLDRDLAGKPGVARMFTDVKRRGIETESTRPPEPGWDLHLTIDERIQFATEQALEAAMETYHAKTGSVVVMDPRNGEVLALASYPNFDPNLPPRPGEDPSVRFNHAVQVPFEPGSVFKIITLSAGLETGRIDEDTPIDCGTGSFNLFGRVIHEAKHGYGRLTATQVLAKSSNIGAIRIGLRVGPEKLHEFVRAFGFGQPTGIPIPRESRGMVWALKDWRKTSIGSVAMGHEISATTLQLARACSVVANGGLLVSPRLVLYRQRPKLQSLSGAPGETVERRTDSLPEPVRVLRPETAIKMRRMMEAVVLNGTGSKARLNGYSSGGKTGSAQVFDRATRRYTHRYNGSYVGFAPLSNPRVVIAVTLNEVSLFGGVVAAPVFRQVATETLRLLDVPKDLPETANPPESTVEEANDVAIAGLGEPPAGLSESLAASLEEETAPTAGPPVLLASNLSAPMTVSGPRVPSFQGKTLRTVLEEAVARGLRLEVSGSGIARAQLPPPGAILRPGESVRVQFAR